MSNNNISHGGSGAIYGLGLIGSLIYFLKGAATLGAIIIAVGKSIVWPGFLVYYLLAFLQI